MSYALDRFKQMLEHCESCHNRRVVVPDQQRCQIRVECACGEKWAWKLLTELKQRQPEGYCEKLFQDIVARKRLLAFVNGVLVVEDEVEL